MSILKNKIVTLVCCYMTLIMMTSAWAGEPTLELVLDKQTRYVVLSELLAHPATRTIDIPADVAYHRAMTYRAIPLSALLPNLVQVETVQFTALDGFVANIPGAVFTGKARPWIALESTDTKWPALKPDGPSAGPFYLVWLAAEKAGITSEYWPYQISKIAEMPSLQSRYPQILPQASLASNSSAQRGLKVFIANCAVCHQINGGGDASIGPDLNQPFNPTEYFREPFLRRLIRNPSSVRSWKQQVMPGFSESTLSDAQLNDLLAYLRQMARQSGR